MKEPEGFKSGLVAYRVSPMTNTDQQNIKWIWTLKLQKLQLQPYIFSRQLGQCKKMNNDHIIDTDE